MLGYVLLNQTLRYNICMDSKSKTFLIVFTFLVVFSAFITYYQYVVTGYFDVITDEQIFYESLEE